MSIIFVTGSSRSGTTMMSRVLNQNSSVFSFNELHFFEQLCEPSKLNSNISYDEALALCDRLLGIQYDGFLLYKQKEKYNDEAKNVLTAINEEGYTPVAIYQAFIKHVTLAHKKQTGCDQTPRNVLYIEDILNNINDAKIICLVRDPRSVLLSQKYKWKRKFLGASKIPLKESIRSYFNYHPYTITKLWAAAARQSIKWKDNENVLLVKFEDVLDNPETAVQNICAFLNITFQPGMLKIPNVGSSIKADLDNELKISASKKEVWRSGGLSKSELYICQKVAGEYMDELNYEKEVFATPYISTGLQVVTFPFKTIISLLFNIRRVKNLRQAILKRL